MRSDVKELDASDGKEGAAGGRDAAPPTPTSDGRSHQSRRRRLSIIGGVASATLFCVSLYVLWRTVSELNASDVAAAFSSVTGAQLAIAIGLTCTSYILLTGYDFLALRQMRLRVPYRTTALASFTSYAVSFTLGFPLVTAGTVRYRIYSAKGLGAAEVSTLTVIAGLTFWLGMGVVMAWSLVREAGAIAVVIHTRIFVNQLLGVAIFGLVLGYLLWVSLKHRAATIQGWRLELPGFKVTIGQMVLGAGDVCAGAGVLYALLPAGHHLSYETFLAIYVGACMLGIASHSPGGLGVFEPTILLALSSLPGERVLGALLLFRLYYYLVPFIVALLLLTAHEVRHRMRVRGRAPPA